MVIYYACMLKKIPSITILCFALCSNAVYANHSNHQNEVYELAGVMKNHVHTKNTFMVGYSMQYAKTKGLYNQTDAEAQALYHSTPDEMSMKMHMLDFMYGVTDRLNVGIMPQFMTMDMKHYHVHTDDHGWHDSQGFGDTKIHATYEVVKPVLASLGFSLPTGSISMQSNGSQQAYMMQTGSGSYELLPTLTYVKNYRTVDFGVQTNASIKLNDNAHGYKFGNSYNVTAWAGKNFNHFFGSHIRLDYTNVERIQGWDSSLDASKTAVNNPALQFREVTTAFLGANFYTPNGIKFLLEGGVPLYQNLGQGTLKNSYSVNFTVRKSFH